MDSESHDEFLRELARAPARAPQPERLAHFRIRERIGQGGMGVVFRADDEKLHRTIALKVLASKDGNAEEQRQRFLREARAAARLTHPNIAVVHEVGEDDGIAYIAMELVEGTTLRSIMREGPLPIQRAVSIAVQIARGLACAHEAKIVHRDLKPENVIIGKNDHAKIVDFGLAKQSVPADVDGFRTDEGRVLGTPAYMSPEQARGKDVTSASDVFAFGVMLYEMLTAQRPFAGESLVDLMVAIEHGKRGSTTAITPEVNGLLDRCLASEASERLPDGGHLVDAIGSLSNVGPTNAPKRIAVPVAVGGLVLVLVALAFVASARSRSPETSAAPRTPTTIPVEVSKPFTASASAAVPVVAVPPSASTAPIVRPRPNDSLPRTSALPSTSAAAPKPRNDFDRQ